MLDQQVTCSDLATVPSIAVGSSSIGSDFRSAVVLRHVSLELFGVGSWGRFPSRQFLRFVEVVREVLGIRVADFPAGGQACICLSHLSAIFNVVGGK